MYSNGGYLMLDFKNSTLTSTPVKIEGIRYDTIINTKKPIIACNIAALGSYVVEMNSFVLSKLSTRKDKIILILFAGTGTVGGIEIASDDTINFVLYPFNASTLSLESEVSANASESDSNTDK